MSIFANVRALFNRQGRNDAWGPEHDEPIGLGARAEPVELVTHYESDRAIQVVVHARPDELDERDGWRVVRAGGVAFAYRLVETVGRDDFGRPVASWRLIDRRGQHRADRLLYRAGEQPLGVEARASECGRFVAVVRPA